MGNTLGEDMTVRLVAALIGLFTLGLVFATSVSASTVTLNFNGVTNSCGACGPGFPTSIVEQGYTISGSPSTLVGGSVHLDDAGTSFSNFVSISATNLFSVSALDVTGYTSKFLDGNGAPLAFGNVLFQGFRNGVQVASSVFSTGVTGGLFHTMLGPQFSNLNLFRITQQGPSATDFAVNRGSYCSDYPCGHVDIDNVTLVSAVPLPAMDSALVAGLAMLGLFGYRRRPV